jgi:lipopolysaccharide exporter
MDHLQNITRRIKPLFGHNGTLTRRTITGGFWALTSAALSKASSLLRTLILARILAPDDFGLFGLVVAITVGINVFSETGITLFLIQKRHPSESHWNTAWCISTVRGITLFSLCWAISVPIAKFYNQPILQPMLRVLAISYIFQGVTNIHIHNLQRTMNFKKKVILDQISETIGNLVSILLAFILHNVWALVAGNIFVSITAFILSYASINVRSKYSLDKEIVKELFRFSHPLLLVSIIVYIVTTVDDLVVGRIIGITALGYYAMAYNIANVATLSVSRTFAQVTLPAYSAIRDDKNRLSNAFYRVLSVNTIICVPICIGMITIAPDIVDVVLGEKWRPIITSFRILCVLGLVRSIASVFGPLIIGSGKTTKLRNIKIVELLIFAPFIYPVSLSGSIEAVSAFTTFIYIISLTGHLLCSKDLVRGLYPFFIRISGLVTISSIIMAIIVFCVKSFALGLPSFPGLLCQIGVGIIAYIPFSILLYKKVISLTSL